MFIRHTSSRRAYCARREIKLRPCDKLCTVRLGVVCNVHLAKPDGVHTIPCRGVVRSVYVAKTRWCPYHTRLCGETGWRPYDTQCTFIRHYVSASCIVCTSRNPMSSIRHAVDVYMTYISACSVLCTSRNSQADMRHTVHVRTTCDLATCVLCTSQNQMTFKRH